MTIYRDEEIPELDAAQDEDSYQYLWRNAPIYARAVESAVNNGRTPAEIKERFTRRAYGLRPEMAVRLEQAARHYARQRETA